MRTEIHQPRLRARRALCVLLLAVAAATAVRPAAAAAEAAPPGYLGVNAQFLFPFFPSWYVDGHLDAMRAGGLQTVRTDASWHEVEPDAPVDGVHDYRWARLDSQVAALASRGLRWLPVIGYSARWASSEPGVITAPPASAADYADYARAVAARYGRGGRFWQERPELPAVPVTAYEIWNEPNYATFWRPEPDAGRYADLYLAARAAIRSVDPGSQSIVGGLNGAAPANFLRAMYAERPGLRGQVDAVGIHPYAGSTQAVVRLIADMRTVLDERGGTSVPIDVTEIGWSTAGESEDHYLAASDRERGARLAWLVEHLARSDCGVERFIPHTWVTGEQDPSDGEQWFGLYHPDGTPTEGGRAYTEAALRVKAGWTGPVEPLCRAAGGGTGDPASPPGRGPTPPESSTGARRTGAGAGRRAKCRKRARRAHGTKRRSGRCKARSRRARPGRRSR